jgi:hypothetical protein
LRPPRTWRAGFLYLKSLKLLLLVIIFILLPCERGSVVVKALCYKPEGREFETWWGEFLNLPNPSTCSRHWGLPSL